MKDYLQQLTAKGRTREAIKQLLELTSNIRDGELREEVLLQSARYQEYAKGKRQGISTQEEQQIAIARINQALLQVIDDLPITITNSNPPGHQDKDHTLYRRWWQWIAGAAVIIGILAGIAELSGYNLRSIFVGETMVGPLQLTVYVHGPKGKQDIVLDDMGTLVADFGNRRDTRRIGEDGRTNFGEIDRRFLGKAIGLSVDAKGYEVTHPDSTYIYDGEPIYLAVSPDRQLGIVRGKVLSRDGKQFLPGVLIELAGVTTLTDNKGNFYLELPSEHWREEYLLYARKEGYQSKEEKYYPKLGGMEIRLTPENNER